MIKRLIFGALAGATGGLAMKAVVRLLDRNSFGLSAKTDAAATFTLCRMLHRLPMNLKDAERIGAAMHYGLAIAAGAAYAGAAPALPVLRSGRGSLFGAALWLIADEAAVSAAGLEDPFSSPLRSHMSALGAHILYGMLVDLSVAFQYESD